jgi:competence protein ComEC
MVGIFCFAERIRQYLLQPDRLGDGKGNTLRARLTRWLASSVSVSLSAVSFTTPLCAIYFGSISLVGVLTNLLTLTVTTFAFYGIMVACALGVFATTAGQIAAWVVSWGLRYVTFVAKVLADFPLAAVYTKSDFIVIWLIFVYVLLGTWLLWRRLKPWMVCCISTITLCAALMLSWAVPIIGNYRITAVDVGQGQCLILQSGSRIFVVDCGGSNSEMAADAAAQTLLSRGVSRSDGLIITHYDKDHAGGAVYLLSRIQADHLFLPTQHNDSATCSALSAYTDGEIFYVDRDLELTFDAAKLSVFASDLQESGNESSLCVLFQAENCDILITGDRSALGERLLMDKADLPDLEVLVVGHHGSKNSTDSRLLQATKPDVAVISVGKNNSYGHPAQQVLDRLKEAGCFIARTDQDGTIIIRG